MSVEFPVSQETLTRLILDNEVESDIFKVNITNCIIVILLHSPITATLMLYFTLDSQFFLLLLILFFFLCL